MNIPVSRTLAGSLFLAAAIFLNGCGGEPDTDKASQLSSPVLVFDTSMGKISMELDMEKAPITAKNFLQYAQDGFFDGTIFHRVIPNFVIQGGGFDVQMQQKATRPPIQNEAGNGLKNLRGTISMARTADPHSASSQFFINLRDNPSLDANSSSAGYAVFGKIIKGMKVVDKIAEVQTGGRSGHQNVPLENVIVNSVSIEAE